MQKNMEFCRRIWKLAEGAGIEWNIPEGSEKGEEVSRTCHGFLKNMVECSGKFRKDSGKRQNILEDAMTFYMILSHSKNITPEVAGKF